jgi:ParB-like chromosome segregation protein Spo0J
MAGANGASMEFHDAANIFPIDDENITTLADDIRANGQQVEIELLDGKVLDGRRRWLACQMAGKKPRTKTVEVADPVAYVLSLNLHRRHLSTSQASACAARAASLRETIEADAKERQKLSKGRGQKGGANCPDLNDAGRSRDKIGEMFGISGKSVDRATRVLSEGIPELVKSLDSGKVSVNKAAYIATHEPEMQSDLLEAELSKKQATQQRAKPKSEESEPQPGERRGVGIIKANEAINSLSRIPKNDALRKRGFQLVTDWIKHNR